MTNEDFPPRSEEENNEISLRSGKLAYDLLMLRGENFKMIHWGDEAVDDFPIASKLNELSTKCTGLRKFSSGKSGGGPWFRVFGELIQSLVFYRGVTLDNIHSVAAHCTNLRDLTLNLATSSDIKGSNLWKQIGNTLEVLKLHVTVFTSR